MPTVSKVATDKLDEIKYGGKTLRKADVIKVLHDLPDMAALTTSEAAIFLGYSVSQMERMRVSGNGPRYQQSPPMIDLKTGKPKKGTNLAVSYAKIDLLQWREAHTAGSSNEHAKLHGRLFATLGDISEEIAFYVHPDGSIESVVVDNAPRTVIDRVGEWDIVWMSAADACGRAWSDAAAHRELAAAAGETLSKAIRSVEAGLEATEMRQASEGSAQPAAPEPSPRRRDTL